MRFLLYWERSPIHDRCHAAAQQQTSCKFARWTGDTIHNGNSWDFILLIPEDTKRYFRFLNIGNEAFEAAARQDAGDSETS